MIAVKRPSDPVGQQPEPRPDNRPKLVKFDLTKVFKKKKKKR